MVEFGKTPSGSSQGRQIPTISLGRQQPRLLRIEPGDCRVLTAVLRAGSWAGLEGSRELA